MYIHEVRDDLNQHNGIAPTLAGIPQTGAGRRGSRHYRARKSHLILTLQYPPVSYMEDIVMSLGLYILPPTPAIAGLAESGIYRHSRVEHVFRVIKRQFDSPGPLPRTDEECCSGKHADGRG
jgi:hypothetical protein